MPVVLAWAAYSYLHDPYRLFDLAAQAYPFDPDHDTTADLPAAVRQLDGRRVVVDGYMIPIDQSEQIHRFSVVPKFGIGWGLESSSPPPPMQQMMLAMSVGPVSYFPGRLRVAGRLHVGTVREDVYTVGVYTMDVDYMEQLDRPVSRWPPIVVGTLAVVATVPVGVGLTRRRRRLAGRCVGCGYDLRMTPARCPECGRAAVAGTI